MPQDIETRLTFRWTLLTGRWVCLSDPLIVIKWNKLIDLLQALPSKLLLFTTSKIFNLLLLQLFLHLLNLNISAILKCIHVFIYPVPNGNKKLLAMTPMKICKCNESREKFTHSFCLHCARACQRAWIPLISVKDPTSVCSALLASDSALTLRAYFPPSVGVSQSTRVCQLEAVNQQSLQNLVN